MAIRPIQSHELLDLAERLANGTGGPGRPRTIELRRAVSTAYYAVFHKLGQHAAMRLIGDGWTSRHSAVARWIAHADLAKLADASNGLGNSALQAAMQPVDPRLSDLSQRFVDLQVARHDADYNDLFNITREEARLAVGSARRAVDHANELFEEKELSYLRFLGYLKLSFHVTDCVSLEGSDRG